MRQRLLLATLAVLIWAALGAAAPAVAQGGTPQIVPLRTVRDSTLLAFNGRPLQVCEREWQSWNRVHGVCRDLATASVYGQRLIAGTVVEFVLFDGTRYERVNDQAAWSASPDPGFAPDRDLAEAFFRIEEQARLSRLGAAQVGALATVQYQYWVLDKARNAEAGGQVVYDQFVMADGRVARSLTSVRGAIPGLGDGELVELRDFRDFDAPLTIAPPTP